MKIKMSTYWWCQLIGWGTFALAATVLFFFNSEAAAFSSYFAIVNTALLGLLTTQLMRYSILRSNILSRKIWVQFICMFLLALSFSFIYFFLQVAAEYLLSPEALKKQGQKWSIRQSVVGNFNFLIIWIFIYFSYHYIQKSRRHLIDAIRLESELKIQQLEQEKASVEVERNVSNYHLMALRYQMNPHFIFNCLNSIKLYTTQNDTASASVYLGKFSKLMRLVMENSSKGKVLLSSEIETLRLYLEMETMRLKEKLQYSINISNDVEADYIEIPALLIQPYVENAIWHGIMPKENGGKIDIDISVNNEKSMLELVVTDNGVGRKKSAAAKIGKLENHESYGLKITADRIGLINKVYKSGAVVMVRDLNEQAGTVALIQIPI